MSGWSRDACIAALQDAAERVGHSPTRPEYQDLGLSPASQTIVDTFGSWNAAKEAAGLEAYHVRVTRERCLEAIRDVAADLGHPPTQPEYEDRAEGAPLPSVPSIYTRFGGFVAAREAALADPDE